MADSETNFLLPYLLDSGAKMVELLNSGDRLGQLDRLGQSNWWNGQIGSDTVFADISTH